MIGVPQQNVPPDVLTDFLSVFNYDFIAAAVLL